MPAGWAETRHRVKPAGTSPAARQKRKVGQSMFRRVSIPFAVLLLAVAAAFGLGIVVFADPSARPALLLLTAGLAVVGIGTAFAVAARLTRRMGRPLRAMTRAAERLGAGGDGSKVFTESRDEIGALARAFNRMKDALGSRIAALEEDRQQLRAILSGMVEGRRRPRRRHAHPVRQRPSRRAAGVRVAQSGRPPALGGGAAPAAARRGATGPESAGTLPRGAAAHRRRHAA